MGIYILLGTSPWTGKNFVLAIQRNLQSINRTNRKFA